MAPWVLAGVLSVLNQFKQHLPSSSPDVKSQSMRPELVKEARIPLSGDGLLNAPLRGEGSNFPDSQEPGQPQSRDISGAG